MSKKNSTKARRLSEFSDRPKVKRQEVAPVAIPEEQKVEEQQEVDSSVPEEEILEGPEVDIQEPAKESEGPPKFDYKELKVPIGTKKENGVILAVILSTTLILSLLGFLFYYEYTWRLQEEQEQEDVLVDSKYESLTNVVRNYVATIEETNKEDLCKQLKAVYLNAGDSTEDIDSIFQYIREQSQEILGFNDRVAKTKEHEWYKLFGVHGVIDIWLTDSGITITKDNQKAIFTAIAEGLN